MQCICHAILRHAKANNNYMKNYDKNKESCYLMHLDGNNLYGWAMSQKLLVDDFKWKEDYDKFDEEFIKNHDEGNNKGYILEADIDCPNELHDIHSDLSFLAERMKINKCNKLVCNLYDIYNNVFT